MKQAVNEAAPGAAREGGRRCGGVRIECRERSNGRRTSRRWVARSVALAVALGIAVAISTPAAALETRYGIDDSNPLLVAYHFTYPIGALIDTVIFKPILFVGNHINPRAGQSSELDLTQNCRALRPQADCSLRKNP